MKHKEYMRVFYKKRKDERKCLSCGRFLGLEEKTRCSKCLGRAVSNERKRIDKGICLGCGNQRDGSHSRLCRKCRNMRNLSMADKKIQQKKMGIELLGGKCNHCGVSFDCIDVYDFHHIDPTKKTLNIGFNLISGGKWEPIWEEMKKCILLCSNCHRILHYKLRRGINGITKD